MPEIAERLAASGYIAEIVSVKHNTSGYGSTKGIGDILVWRDLWAQVTGLPGLKLNLEVKTSEAAPLTKEQRLSLGLGGLAVCVTPDDALAKVSAWEAKLLAPYGGLEANEGLWGRSVGSVGMRSFLPARTPKKKRETKWLKEAREAAK